MVDGGAPDWMNVELKRLLMIMARRETVDRRAGNSKVGQD